MGEYAVYDPDAEGDQAVPRIGAEDIRRARSSDGPGIAALSAARHGMPLERALDGVKREFAGIAAGNPWTLVVADVGGGVVGRGVVGRIQLFQLIFARTVSAVELNASCPENPGV